LTVGGGALFGMIGLTLAAPLTSAAVHISAALRERTEEADLPVPPAAAATVP
jgi:predicted PurR-regulated permease PerM